MADKSDLYNGATQEVVDEMNNSLYSDPNEAWRWQMMNYNGMQEGAELPDYPLPQGYGSAPAVAPAPATAPVQAEPQPGMMSQLLRMLMMLGGGGGQAPAPGSPGGGYGMMNAPQANLLNQIEGQDFPEYSTPYRR